MGSEGLRSRRLLEARRAVALGAEEGAAKGQECLPPEQGEDGKGCPGTSQVKDLTGHVGLRQVVCMLSFLLSQFSGDFLMEEQPLKNSEELMGLRHGRFSIYKTVNLISGTKTEQLLGRKRVLAFQYRSLANDVACY